MKRRRGVNEIKSLVMPRLALWESMNRNKGKYCEKTQDRCDLISVQYSILEYLRMQDIKSILDLRMQDIKSLFADTRVKEQNINQ